MQLASLEASKSDTLRLAASTIRSMLNEGVFEFTKSDWIGRTGMSTSQYKFFRNEMKKRKMAVFVGDPDNAYPNNEGVFRFSIAEDLAGIPDMQPIPLSIPDEAAPAIESADSDIAPGTETTILDDGDMDAEIWDDNRAEPELYRDLPIQWFPTYESIPSLQTLTTISFGDDSPRIQRIHDFLIHRGSDEAYFTADDWAEYCGITQTSADKDIMKAYYLGLLERAARCDRSSAFCYRPVSGRSTTFRLFDFADFKRALLNELYRKYGRDPFTKFDFAHTAHLDRNSIHYKMSEYIDRGLFQRGRSGRRVFFRLAVTPEDHPECFLLEQKELMLAGVG
jgi:hypothetical protein